ncbi:MAG: preprotein translocase subunit SecE [Rubrobacteraceae bacterium]
MGKKRGSTATKGANKNMQQRRQQPRGRIAATGDFVRGVRNELRRVNWPNRDQLRQSTAVVLIIVVTLGLYVAAWDFVFNSLSRLVFL